MFRTKHEFMRLNGKKAESTRIGIPYDFVSDLGWKKIEEKSFSKYLENEQKLYTLYTERVEENNKKLNKHFSNTSKEDFENLRQKYETECDVLYETYKNSNYSQILYIQEIEFYESNYKKNNVKMEVKIGKVEEKTEEKKVEDKSEGQE